MVKGDFKLFVEGGAKGRLNRLCREGFGKFLEKAGLKNKMPRITACGGRQSAYKDFRNALDKAKPGDVIILLVDSEAPITETDDNVWKHVLQREGDKWESPRAATAKHLHFMVECMEAWFMADKQCLAAYFGQGFDANQLSKRTNIENIPKLELMLGLENATKHCKTKAKYDDKGGKGEHSFELLGRIDPKKSWQHRPMLNA